MLDVDDPAPDFTLQAADGSGVYMLSAAADAGPVVLAFAPADDQRARDLFEGLAGMDWATLADRIAVFGICPDEATAGALPDLPFPALVDGRGYVADLYGVPGRPGGGPRTALVLSDTRCTIRYRWVADSDGSAPLSALADAVTRL
jgi:peroxiredoxin